MANLNLFGLALGLALGLASVPAWTAPPAVPVPSPSATRAAFDAADLDHDGFISLDEFHKNALQAWRALDRDGDGYITREELAPLPRTLRLSLLGSLRRADTDGDLRLSFKEVMAARMADFDAADANHDDRLSLAEVLAFEARQRPRRP